MRSQAQSVARLNNLVSSLEAETDKLKITLFHVTKLLPQTMINEITVAFETAQDTAAYEQLLKTLVAAIQKDVSTSLAEGHAAASGSGDAGARDPTEAGSVVGTAAALTAAALMVDGDGSGGAAAAANNDTAAPDPPNSPESGAAAAANNGTAAPDPPNSPENGEQHPAENDDENDDGENDDDENDDDDGSGAGAAAPSAGAAAPSAPAPPAPHAPPRAAESLLAAKKIVLDTIQNCIDGGDKSLHDLVSSLGAESKLNLSSAANPEEDIARAKVSFRLMDSGGVVARFKIGHALQRSWDKWKQDEPSMNQAEFRKKIGTMGFIIAKTKMSECLIFARVITKYKAYRFLYNCSVEWTKVNLCMRFSGLDKALEHSQSTNAAAFNHLRHDVDLE